MNKFTNLRVLGYHGTIVPSAINIVATRSFKLSSNRHDWLGDGAYFFQDAPLRAWLWAKREAKIKGSEPAVVEAEIYLGQCLDLLDVKWSHFVRVYHKAMEKAALSGVGKELPTQKSPIVRTKPRSDFLLESIEPAYEEKGVGDNRLDRKVFNFTVERLRREVEIDSVRAAFAEGYPLYKTSFLYDRSHIQIAVRDTAKCITGDLLHLDIDQLESRRNDVNNGLSHKVTAL